MLASAAALCLAVASPTPRLEPSVVADALEAAWPPPHSALPTAPAEPAPRLEPWPPAAFLAAPASASDEVETPDARAAAELTEAFRAGLFVPAPWRTGALGAPW